MAYINEENRGTAARFIIRRSADTDDVFMLERSFARIPNVGETIIFSVSILEYELTFYGDDATLYTTVVQVVYQDGVDRPTVYCEPARSPFPDWAP